MSNGETHQSYESFGPGPWRRSFDDAVEAAWDEAKARVLEELGPDYDISRDEFVILETRVRGYNPISDYRIELGRPPRP